jgi:hypothetical protein
MTAVERAFVARLRRRASNIAPELARRELQAYELIRQILTERELVEAIESGQLDRLILELLSDENMDPSLVRLRARIDLAVVQSVRGEAVQLPTPLRGPVFGVLNPRIVEAAQRLNTKVVAGLKEEVRQTVLQAATAGLEEGVHPRTVARRIREAVGLAPSQEQAIRNFRRALEEGDVARALRYKLRDKRFDGAIRRGGLTRERIDKMVDVYRRRWIAHNAETHARTIALDAQKLGQRKAWEDAIDRGVVRRDSLVRTWVAVGGPHGDGRNRPEHLAMHGEQVGFDQPFSNGEQEPGESTYNCRCVARVTVAVGTQARREAA